MRLARLSCFLQSIAKLLLTFFSRAQSPNKPCRVVRGCQCALLTWFSIKWVYVCIGAWCFVRGPNLSQHPSFRFFRWQRPLKQILYEKTIGKSLSLNWIVFCASQVGPQCVIVALTGCAHWFWCGSKLLQTTVVTFTHIKWVEFQATDTVNALKSV